MRVGTTRTHRELSVAGRDDVAEEDDAHAHHSLMACHQMKGACVVLEKNASAADLGFRAWFTDSGCIQSFKPNRLHGRAFSRRP